MHRPEKGGSFWVAFQGIPLVGFRHRRIVDIEKTHRERSLAKLRAELIPYEGVAGGPGTIPGLGPHENSAWVVPIPLAG
jgi:hypothetical protein